MTTRISKDMVDKLYMCSTDFDCELGNVIGGVRVYTSVEDLKKHMGCTTEKEDYHCGIYEVEIRLVKVIQESTS